MLGRTIGAVRYRAPLPSPFLIFSNPLSLSFPFDSLSLLWVYHCPLWVFLPPLVGFSSPFVAFYQSPWWLAAPWWQGVLDVATFVPLAYGLEASSNLSTSLKRFRSESLLLYPPCLRLDLFKHLIIVCPYAWFAWSLLPCLYRFKQKIIRSIEDWFSIVPACHMLIWTSLAIDALTALLVVCKSHVLGSLVVLFVIAFVVFWFFMCFCNRFLPGSIVLPSVF